MDYEKLYSDSATYKKDLKDKLDAQNKGYKKIVQAVDNGDLSSLLKLISSARDTAREQERILSEMEQLVSEFDAKEYIESGDFAEQMLRYCEEMGVDVKGDFPVYEMFPYKIQISAETTDITVDRKKVACMRPLKLVSDIKTELSKLSRASFNTQVFAKELSAAYDLALLRQSKGKPYTADADFYLTNLYEYLTPMRRFRKDYDKQSYAFDLARLYASEAAPLDDGRRFQFGPSRNNAKAIRILDQNGTEQYIATIRFFKG